LRNIIRKALRKTVWIRRGRKGRKRVQIQPNESIVYGVSFAVAALAGLVVLQIAHMALFGTWNSEIFAAITGLIGTITGVFISQKA
jgi:uncharacterized Tic20 family protein